MGTSKVSRRRILFLILCSVRYRSFFLSFILHTRSFTWCKLWMTHLLTSACPFNIDGNCEIRRR
jgi:hypothetical protein